MVQVILPLGYPALSGEVEQMIIYQGTVARLYMVPNDPRTDSQMFQRKLLSDVSKMRGAAGKWAKASWKITFGTKWASIIYQLVRGDVNSYWSEAFSEFELMSSGDRESWDIAAPYQATFNRTGKVFYALARVLYRWCEDNDGVLFYQPDATIDDPALMLAWWMSELSDFGFRVQTQPEAFVDDRDVRWIFNGSWNTWNGAGPKNNTLMQSSANGDWAEIELHCSWIRVAYMENSDCGTFKVYVDGVEAAIVDAEGVAFTSRNWVDILRSAGMHMIRVVNTGTGGQKMNLDGVFGHIFYLQPDVDLSFGIWEAADGGGAYGHVKYHTTSEGEAGVEFNFVGSYLSIGFTSSTLYGLMDVYIDGVKLATIDQYTADENLNRSAIVGRVAFGLHRARLEKAGAGQINMGTIYVLRSKNELIV